MASKFWVGGTGTWDSTTTTHWASSTGGAGGVAAPITGDIVTFDANSGGGTVTVDSTINGLSLISLTAGAFTGTLDFSVNNPSLTFTSGSTGMSLMGSGTRNIKLGSGTFTLQNGTFDCSTTTGLTASFASANFVFTSTGYAGSQTFAGGGQSYGSLTVNGRSGGQGVGINQNNTFGSMTYNGPAWVSTNNTTQTVTTALTVNGSPGNFVSFGGNVATNQQGTYVLPASGVSISGALIRGITFTTNSPGTITNSYDLGGNTLNGGTITNPSGSSSGGVFGS